MSKGKPLAENSSLQLATSIENETIQSQVVSHLKEAAKLKARIKTDSARLDEIETELLDYAIGLESKGWRFGRAGFEYRGQRTKMTLSKTKLVENGVSPSQIEASYEESKPYDDKRFVFFD